MGEHSEDADTEHRLSQRGPVSGGVTPAEAGHRLQALCLKPQGMHPAIAPGRPRGSALAEPCQTLLRSAGTWVLKRSNLWLVYGWDAWHQQQHAGRG